MKLDQNWAFYTCFDGMKVKCIKCFSCGCFKCRLCNPSTSSQYEVFKNGVEDFP